MKKKSLVIKRSIDFAGNKTSISLDSAAVVVSSEFCQLRCDLWLAGGCHRHDDLDVDFRDRHFARRRTQLRDRASNRARLDYGARKAPRPTWGSNGGYGRSANLKRRGRRIALGLAHTTPD
jgi:hypothetical protein